MADINVRFDFSVSRRCLNGAVSAAMFLCAVPELGSESVSLVTYYPAPSGIYTKMITTDNTLLARDSGYVGVGTGVSTLQALLHLGKGGTLRIDDATETKYGRIFHDGSYLNIESRDAGLTGVRINWSGGGGSGGLTVGNGGAALGPIYASQIGIGTMSPDNLLTVNGTADKPGGGSWGVYSDARLKDISSPYQAGLSDVLKLQPLRYRYKKDNALGIPDEGEHVGFSAQEVEKVIPEAVTRNSKGYRIVNNDPILWAMLNALKEQQTTIETLKAQNQSTVEAQQKQIEENRREIAELRAAKAR